MSFENIHVDDFGWIIKLRVVQDDSAVDISSYTTTSMILRDPDGTTSAKSASFSTDGTDGYIQRTVADGDIDAVGVWTISARIAKAGVELTSDPISFPVAKRLD